MARYLLSIYQPNSDPPPPEVLEPIMRDLAALEAELRSAGAWVFSGGLHPPETATVVQAGQGQRQDELLLTDGPFVEGKEYLGGFLVIEAPDLDAALGWASRVAQITTLPIEVRPFQDART